jgi:RimJ/RimL family protein N-acetyltransferase
MDPLLIDLPGRLVTERLLLRSPAAGDGPKLWEALQASLPELQEWMAWATEPQDETTSEQVVRTAQADFIGRRDLAFHAFVRQPAADGTEVEGPLVVACGLHDVDWTLRRFEIGYWRRTGYGGQGVVDEAVHALTQLAFGRLGAQRVEIRVDPENRRSWRVAERCGFAYEGCLRRDALTPAKEPRDTRVYAKVRGVEWKERP